MTEKQRPLCKEQKCKCLEMKRFALFTVHNPTSSLVLGTLLHFIGAIRNSGLAKLREERPKSTQFLEFTQ